MIEILTPGLLATVQDLGRHGYADLGVPRAGAADQASHRLANRLVGNAETAATIEITLGGMAFRLSTAATIAFTGARCDLAGDRPLGWNAAFSVPSGAVVRLLAPAAGLRSYLAVRGGVDVAATLGSRSTDTLSGLGPAPLSSGDTLSVGDLAVTDPSDEAIGPAARTSRPIRLAPGPRADWFEAAAIDHLQRASWTVDATSNRIGVRLAGPALRRVQVRELASEATLPGAIQVPPNGQPIVLGPDAPVTGGYPVVAVVTAADLPLIAQARPGDRLRLSMKNELSKVWSDDDRH
jgi:biotin-dependent carboxylase-like uncharacterized protein